MGQLCIYLTPFASDYSGVCSALFDLKCITAINDAGCCTSHYVYYDEPRWDENVRPVFSTAIRNIDSILGNDDKIINSIVEAAESIDGEMISVIGTPVPALIGMDMDGIAAEIEFRAGKPAFGFNTTGFDYYDKGIYLAGKALIDRFSEQKEVVKGRVNICGMTPLDYGACGNEKLLEEILQAKGFEPGCRFFMGITKEQIEDAASAEFNLAVSSSGLKIAKYLKRKFGTPYITGFPVGNRLPESWPLKQEAEDQTQSKAVLKQKICDNTTQAIHEANDEDEIHEADDENEIHEANDEDEINEADDEDEINEADDENEIHEANDEDEIHEADLKIKKRVLIISDQVLGNSLREALDAELPCDYKFNVATFFGFDKEIAKEGDLRFTEEADYLKLLKQNKYDILIADPDILSVPGTETYLKIPVVHPAVSSQLKWNEAEVFDEKFLERVVTECER